MKSQQESPSSVLEKTDHNELIAQRRAKLNTLREKGVAYPNGFRRESLASDLHAQYDEKDHDTLANLSIRVSVAGRILMRRLIGKASFLLLQDMSGKIQVYLTQNDLY